MWVNCCTTLPATHLAELHCTFLPPHSQIPAELSPIRRLHCTVPNGIVRDLEVRLVLIIYRPSRLEICVSDKNLDSEAARDHHGRKEKRVGNSESGWIHLTYLLITLNQDLITLSKWPSAMKESNTWSWVVIVIYFETCAGCVYGTLR